MANNVYTVITIESSKEAIEKITNLLHSDEIEKADWMEKSSLLADKLYKLIYPNFPENPSREWMIENLGAKWCFVHDWSYGEDYIDLTFESAWHTPEELFHQLGDFINETIEDEYSMELRSEDEAYLHIAGGFATNDGSEVNIEDEYEISYPDSEDEKYKNNDDLYDEDLNEFYDHINELKESLIEESRKIILDEVEDLKEETKEETVESKE
tara:strand:+ start:148 stop:783 length:636 start_codon:yes stop_codon:yes gene_type:complete